MPEVREHAQVVAALEEALRCYIKRAEGDYSGNYKAFGHRSHEECKALEACIKDSIAKIGPQQVRDRLGTFAEQVDKAGAAVRRVVGGVRAAVTGALSTLGFAPDSTPAAEAVKPFAHLLVLQPLKPGAAAYYFNLDTAAFDQLRRQTRFRWAGQERLSRASAQQAVGLGEETISIRGAIFPTFKGGLGQLQALRSIGRQLQPLSLTTGYGEVLGNWCLTSIEEEQSNLLAGGIPRKQGFSLEFISYGDDLQNV